MLHALKVLARCSLWIAKDIFLQLYFLVCFQGLFVPNLLLISHAAAAEEVHFVVSYKKRGKNDAHTEPKNLKNQFKTGAAEAGCQTITYGQKIGAQNLNFLY